MFKSINVLLKRNSELRFIQSLDVDYLINESVKLFQQQTNSNDPYKDFYNLPISLVGRSTGYMIRVIINSLFNANIQKSDGNEGNTSANSDICKISLLFLCFNFPLLLVPPFFFVFYKDAIEC
jgi:hypothetical protein